MKKIVIWGADPGLNGAIVAIEGGDVVRVEYIVPAIISVVSEQTGRSTSRIDVYKLFDFCSELAKRYPPHRVVLEKVGAFPGQGANGTFSFGHSAGVFETVLRICAPEAELLMPRPAEWKRDLHMLRKNASKIEKKRLSVSIANDWLVLKDVPMALRMKDDGIAEAILLACWGYKPYAEEIRQISDVRAKG